MLPVPSSSPDANCLILSGCPVVSPKLSRPTHLTINWLSQKTGIMGIIRRLVENLHFSDFNKPVTIYLKGLKEVMSLKYFLIIPFRKLSLQILQVAIGIFHAGFHFVHTLLDGCPEKASCVSIKIYHWVQRVVPFLLKPASQCSCITYFELCVLKIYDLSLKSNDWIHVKDSVFGKIPQME